MVSERPELCNKLCELRMMCLANFAINLYLSQVDSMFPVVRLLLPQLDMVRGTYGLKEVRCERLSHSLPPARPLYLLQVCLRNADVEVGGLTL